MTISWACGAWKLCSAESTETYRYFLSCAGTEWRVLTGTEYQREADSFAFFLLFFSRFFFLSLSLFTVTSLHSTIALFHLSLSFLPFQPFFCFSLALSLSISVSVSLRVSVCLCLSFCLSLSASVSLFPLSLALSLSLPVCVYRSAPPPPFSF